MRGECSASADGSSVSSIAVHGKNFWLEAIENRPDVCPPEKWEELTWWSLSVVSGISIVGAIKTVATAMSTAKATPILNTLDII